jgi:thiamine pyrophosphokinase
LTFDYLIFAGGRLPALSFTKKLIGISQNIVTVDRGAELALRLRVRPLLHVGDGDSFSFSKLKKLKAQAVMELSPDKCISDLEFTLNQLDPLKTKVVIGAHNDFEARPDHGFLNLLLLSEFKNLYFADEKVWATGLVPEREFSFSARKNSIFSIAGLGHPMTAAISGSAYDSKAKVFENTTQGLSNLTRSKWTRVKVTSPALLFVSSNLLQTIIDD